MNHKPSHPERANDESPTASLERIPGDIDAPDGESEKTDDEHSSRVEAMPVISVDGEPYVCVGVPEHH
jgi:hypothetical protein